MTTREIVEFLDSSRKERGASQADVARDLGVHTNTVRNWRHDYHELSLSQAIAWCRLEGLVLNVVLELVP